MLTKYGPINEVQLYGGGPCNACSVVLLRRRQIDGPDRWAVVDKGCALDKDGDWVQEPIPSSRTDEYLETTRFTTHEEAVMAWQRLDKPTRFWRREAELKKDLTRC